MPLNGLVGTQPKQQGRTDKNGRIVLWPYAPSGEEVIKVKVKEYH